MFLSCSVKLTVQTMLSTPYPMPVEIFAHPVICSRSDPDILKQSALEMVGNEQNHLHSLECGR